MRRSGLGLATGLAFGLLGYGALVFCSRRALADDAPLSRLHPLLHSWLAESSLEAESRYLGTPVGRIHVLVAGSGPEPIVVLPGSGASAGDLAELIARLARNHLVVGVDLPGTGLSDPVSFSGHPQAAWSKVVTAVADELGLERFTLVGHSMGGLAAGGFAIANPTRVNRLVLISPFGVGRTIPFWWTFAMVPGVMDIRGLYERVMLVPRDEWWSRAGEGRDLGLPGEAAQRYRRQARARFGRGSDLGLIGRLLQPLALRPESQLLPALGLLSGRVLVLWGGMDRRLPLAPAERELRHFPGLRLEVVADAGHLLPFLKPDLTARLIESFEGGPPS
ncbi:MAG TPA: alpha/beta hydrolase [Candidatus Dormibacteraeota bacterium]